MIGDFLENNCSASTRRGLDLSSTFTSQVASAAIRSSSALLIFWCTTSHAVWENGVLSAIGHLGPFKFCHFALISQYSRIQVPSNL